MAPVTMLVHVGANSLKKPHHIVILRFSEVVKGHAKAHSKYSTSIFVAYDYDIRHNFNSTSPTSCKQALLLIVIYTRPLLLPIKHIDL